MADYQTIRLGRNERRVFNIGNGETFENVLIDQRASGAAGVIAPRGHSWTIRNVGFKGPMGGTNRCMGLRSTGPAVIENVYVGDGVEPHWGDRSDPSLGMWVAPQHSGTIDVRRMYVEGAHDNAFYASAPGTTGAGGIVNFTNCYAKDNWVAGFRLARGKIENCTAVNSPRGRNGRPVWVWNTDTHPGRVDIVNTNFIAGGYPHSIDVGRPGGSAELYLENVQYDRGTHRRMRQHPDSNVNVINGGGNGANPRDVIPSGCPQSAEAAAAGEWEGAPDEPPSFPDAPDEPEPWDPEGEINWDEPSEIDWPTVPGDVTILDEDQHLVVDVGSGQTLESQFFDCSADNSAVTVRARGRRWRIQQIAIWGEQDHDDADTSFSVATSNGSSGVIENVFAGLGSGGDEYAAIKTASRHAGTIYVNDANIMGWETGIDGSRGTGRVRVNRCWMAHNDVSVHLATDGSDIAHTRFGGSEDRIPVVVDTTDNIIIEDCDFGWLDSVDPDGPSVHSINGGAGLIVASRFADGYDPDDNVFDIEDPDADPPDTTRPLGVSSTPLGTFGRNSPWRRPARQRILIRDVMVRGAEEYGIRAGSDDENVRVTVENCVVDVEGIGLIADTGEVTVRNCDIRGDEMDMTTTNGGSIISIDTRWGDDAIIEPPAGVPLTSSEAARIQQNSSHPGP